MDIKQSILQIIKMYELSFTFYNLRIFSTSATSSDEASCTN